MSLQQQPYYLGSISEVPDVFSNSHLWHDLGFDRATFLKLQIDAWVQTRHSHKNEAITAPRLVLLWFLRFVKRCYIHIDVCICIYVCVYGAICWLYNEMYDL